MKNTERFNLETLPLCGAKTRNGQACKRKGNKKNGRCKLHGGNASGPKTELGKIISSRNADTGFPIDAISQIPNTEFLDRGLIVYKQLYQLFNQKKIDWDSVVNLVKREHLPLESAKYALAEHVSSEALLVVQTALDIYYQDTNSEHLSFHKYKCMVMLPLVNRQWSKSQKKRADDWIKNYKFS